MRQLLFALGISASLYMTGCSAKQSDPQPVTPPPPPVSDSVHVVVTGAKVGPSAGAQFILSTASVQKLTSLDQLLSYQWFGDNTTKTLYDKTLSKKSLKITALYFSLQYGGVNSASFNAPTGTDNVQVQVTIDNKAPITLRLDEETYKTTTNRWVDATGMMNTLVEKSISF